MATYLLVWNPRRWRPTQNSIVNDFEERDGRYYGSWSCGHRRNISPGDRLFGIRLAKEPRGLFFSGWATSPVYEDTHWEDQLNPSTASTNYIDLELDVLLDPDAKALNAGVEPVFPLARLKSGLLAPMHWESQMSGIIIPDAVEAELEREWEEYLSTHRTTIKRAAPSPPTTAQEKGSRPRAPTESVSAQRDAHRLSAVPIQFICAAGSLHLTATIVLRPGEMVIDIPAQPLSRPYLVRGRRIDNFFAGRHVNDHGEPVNVVARWALLGDVYVGLWMEEGVEYYFSFEPPRWASRLEASGRVSSTK